MATFKITYEHEDVPHLQMIVWRQGNAVDILDNFLKAGYKVLKFEELL